MKEININKSGIVIIFTYFTKYVYRSKCYYDFSAITPPNHKKFKKTESNPFKYSNIFEG